MWGLVIFLLGIGFGYLSKERQKARTYLIGVGAGVALAFVFSLLGGLAGLGLPNGAVGMLLSVVILSVFFVVGLWVGDMIEDATHRTA